MSGLNAKIDGPSKALVLCQANYGCPPGDSGGGAVGGAIVHHDHLMGEVGLCFQEVEEPQNQVAALPSWDDKGHCKLGVRRWHLRSRVPFYRVEPLSSWQVVGLPVD